MTRYVARPIEVEAMQWTGDNTREVKEWLQQIVTHVGYLGPAEVKDLGIFLTKKSTPKWIWHQHVLDNDAIDALIWDHLHQAYDPVLVGHFIICGTQHEFYPCDPDVFERKYEAR